MLLSKVWMSCSWAISWGDAFIKVVAVMTGVGAVVDEAIIDGLGGWCGRVDVAVAIFWGRQGDILWIADLLGKAGF